LIKEFPIANLHPIQMESLQAEAGSQGCILKSWANAATCIQQLI
jgi:hypothetical protein